MKNKKRIFILSGSILAIAMIAVGLYFLLTKKDSDSADKPNPDSDTAAETNSMAEKPDEIRIPGYPRITIQADTRDVTMNLINPEGNPCYFTFEIVLTDENETIYVSELVEPGKAITNVKLSRALEKGEYPAIIKITTTSLEGGIEMNGANVETVLVVQ
ncbi:MAG: hypothetical protein ACI4EU_05425 [Butyrivibrio sp.]